jgi:hypothetical protein
VAVVPLEGAAIVTTAGEEALNVPPKYAAAGLIAVTE